MTGVGGIGGTFLDIRTAVKLPDALRGEKVTSNNECSKHILSV